MGEHLRHRKQHSCVGNYADSVGTDDRSEGWREEVGGPNRHRVKNVTSGVTQT